MFFTLQKLYSFAGQNVMQNNKLHIVRSLLLLSLIISVILSSAGIYYTAKEVKSISAKEKSKKKEEKQDEKVSVATGTEAVVVSILNPDFLKGIILFSFDFPILNNKAVLTPKKFLVSFRYFNTLFTHIISPNAP
jgi:hypothetical protein